MEEQNGSVPAEVDQQTLAIARASLDVQGKPEFVMLLQSVTTAAQQVQGINVSDSASYNKAAALLMNLRGIETYITNMKGKNLAFSKLYTAAVNGAYKPLLDTLKIAIDTVEKPMLAWGAELRKKQQEAAAETMAESGPLPVRDLGSDTATPPPSVPAAGEAIPSGVAKMAGGTVFSAQEPDDITITDFEALVKACVSQDQRLAHCTLKMLKPDMAEIRRAGKVAKKSIPGVKFSEKFGIRTRRSR